MKTKNLQSAVALNINQETLCFQPFDNDARLKFRALKVLNDFKKIGFVNRGLWLSEVFDFYPDLNTGEGFKALQSFWSLRYFDADLIQRLEILVDNLKEE